MAHDNSFFSKSRFLSLKWILLFVLCIFMLFVNCTLSWLNYHNQRQQFEDQLLTQLREKEQSLKAQSRYRLFEIANAISMYGYDSDLGGIDLNRFVSQIKNNWTYLQIDWHLTTVGFYDLDAEPMSDFRDYHEEHHWVASDIKAVSQSLVEKTFIRCLGDCHVFILLPLSLHNDDTIIFVLSYSLREFISEISLLSDIDAAMLSPKAQVDSLDGSRLILKSWDKVIVSMTNKEKNFSLLQRFSLQEPFIESLIERGGYVMNDQGERYYINIMSLEKEKRDGQHFLVIIDQVTQQLRTIKKNLKQSIWISSLGLLMSLIVLYILLDKLLLRLKKSSELLPLLADNQFENVRSQLNESDQLPLFHTELDILEKSSLLLADKLEFMGKSIYRRTQELEKMALCDPLTGCANRRSFLHYLDQQFVEYERYQQAFAVAFIDLDNFKQVNDILGHDRGDTVLVSVVKKLEMCLRKCDVIARLGGDEFTVLLQDIDGDQSRIVMVLDRILESLVFNFQNGENNIQVTVSIGVAIVPDHGLDVQTLMHHADIAMYRAKQKGKNQYQFYYHSGSETH